MKRTQKNGFTLIFVVLTLAVVSMALFILTGGSKTIMFQADDAYLHACQNNLSESALAWAKNNNQDENFDKEIQLDLTETNFPRSQVSVKISTSQNQKAKIKVTASCSKARNTLTRKYTYQIDAAN
jgi:type II secretory pathway pseudopilin PulG